jgi:hypothetical protein
MQVKSLATVLTFILWASQLAACAVTASSFETLGVPELTLAGNESAVIVGWAREDRGNWTLQRVQIDGQGRSEWDEHSQRPAVFGVEPGVHRLRLWALQSFDRASATGRNGRRYRLRRINLQLQGGQAQLCVVRIDENRRRPVANCEAHSLYEDEEELEDEYVDSLASAAPAATAPAEAAVPGQTAEQQGAVPSPFGGPPQTAPPTAPPTATAEPPPQTAPSPLRPRRLSLEERVERLERLVDQLQTQGER